MGAHKERDGDVEEAHLIGKKNWEVWPGRNNFYCDGRIITGRDREFFYGAVALIVFPQLLFFVWEGWFMVTKLTPAYGILLLIFDVLLVALVITSLFLASYSDPGIIPRQTVPEETISNPFLRPASQREVDVNGQTLRQKYCDTCQIYRPPRATHCSQCNNCVMQFDHHCPWVGNCIGRRNYHFFLFFVYSVTFALLFTLAVCVGHVLYFFLVQTDESGGAAFVDSLPHVGVTYALAIYAILVMIGISGLSGFHSMLLWRNETTNENLKYLYNSSSPNPHVKKFGMYTIRAFFPTYFPSYLRLRDPVTEPLEFVLPPPDQMNGGGGVSVDVVDAPAPTRLRIRNRTDQLMGSGSGSSTGGGGSTGGGDSTGGGGGGTSGGGSTGGGDGANGSSAIDVSHENNSNTGQSSGGSSNGTDDSGGDDEMVRSLA